LTHKKHTTVFAALALVSAVSGLAWACSPAQDIAITSVTGPDGSVSPVPGGGRVSAIPGSVLEIKLRNGLRQGVEIHWNEANGPLLAVAQSTDASFTAQVPSVSPGVYFVVAVAKEASGQVIGKAAATVAVTSAAGSESNPPATLVSSDLWSGLATDSPTYSSGVVESGRTRPSGVTGLGYGLIGLGATVLFSVAVLGMAPAARRSRSSSR